MPCNRSVSAAAVPTRCYPASRSSASAALPCRASDRRAAYARRLRSTRARTAWRTNRVALATGRSPKTGRIARRSVLARMTIRPRRCQPEPRHPPQFPGGRRNLMINLFLDSQNTLVPRDFAFCEKGSRVRFVPWHRTGTGWTPFEGATGRAISRTSTLPWRAATRHVTMAAHAYVRVQRETRLTSSSYTVDLRHAHEQDRQAPPDHRRGALRSGDNSA